MGIIEFNNKYNDWLEENHYGLNISDPGVIEYLDRKFQQFIKRPDFKFSQIKLKFNMARFYAKGLERFELDDVEFNIDRLMKGKLTPEYP